MAALGMGLLTAGCDEAAQQGDELVSGVEDAWNVAKEATEKAAQNILQEVASTPRKFGKDRYDAEWDSSFDIFTLTDQIDTSSRAALSLFLGDFGDVVNDFDSFARDNLDKEDIEKRINKQFNTTWDMMLISVMALDGTFIYSIESDGLFDNDFEYNAEDIYKFLRAK